MKSEPDVYSIEDLKAKSPAMWEGCRNYTVRNMFRDLFQVGDLAFFYNSNSDPSGVAGIMKVSGLAYPDPTQFDPNSTYYDVKSPLDNPRWLCVDVEFVEQFPRVVPLSQLRSTPGLEEMMVTKRGQRLSVMPVSEDEWKIVLELAASPD